ncbi:ArsR/SmtB family transcription factor [Natronorubrum daqingense]|uniref:Transcriptional regulator n=1 Tax=Natronorubrum daqingense TaxID=588898 RepID=A0A1N7AGJ3_9EURY|nr:metalloregulator ArsR/SmtB family transcription factor [Natronorubrum daqingense]APX97992.1 transcriptional regulator [Natronorubrum daqingense]SIR38124.1 transcriptional regulator, ArsR family [Natronorubrum daqingense]
MSQTDRLRRLLEDELDDCCDADVTDRLAELESLVDAVPTASTSDLAALSTLGDETRHRLVRLLVAAESDLCVCEITPLVDVGDSAVSHALSDLTDAGLVSRRKEGTWRYYRATDRAERLLEALDATRGDRR